MASREFFTEKDFDWEASFTDSRNKTHTRWMAELNAKGSSSDHFAALSIAPEQCQDVLKRNPSIHMLRPVALEKTSNPPTSTPAPGKKLDHKLFRKAASDFDFHLPKLRSEDDSGKRRSLGPGFAVGGGCGAGIGFGFSGGVGFGKGPWNNVKAVFGVGLGCGIGIGYGYGYGFGLRLDQKPGGLPTKRMVLEL